jgi:hypothetical protein
MRHLIALCIAALLGSTAAAQYEDQFPVRPSPGASYGRDAAVVQSWYDRYLGRLPDRSGLETYVGQLQAGVHPSELQARILGSEEFYRRWGSNPNGFINGVYRTALGRVPSRQEVWYWKRQLWRNPDREQVALAILDASEVPGTGQEPDPYGSFGRGYPFDPARGSPRP